MSAQSKDTVEEQHFENIENQLKNITVLLESRGFYIYTQKPNMVHRL